MGRLADSPLHARRLGDSTMHVCAAAAYLDRRGVPRRVAELIQHNCLSYTLSATQDGKRWDFGPRGTSEERRVGKECVRTCISRGSWYHKNTYLSITKYELINTHKT